MTRAANFLKSIAGPGGGESNLEGLESTAPAALPDRDTAVDRLREEADYIASILKEAPDKDVLATLAKDGKEGLDRLHDEREDADLSDDHLVGLEAVIRADGTRPVAFVRDDFVDPNQPSLSTSEWLIHLGGVEPNIRRLCKATGRVDDPSQMSLGYQGTAFLVGPNLVMTNRHVLRAITREGDAENGTLKDDIVIDFRRELGPTQTDRRFPVKAIRFRGHKGAVKWVQPVTNLNFDNLDIAILEIDTGAGTLPDPLPLHFGDVVKFAVRGRKACVLGFPGATAGLTTDVFDKVFSGIKAFKRLAPGLILEPAGEGEIDQDPENWIMTHDASTLGGNSGSPILDLESKASPLLGIHFGGMPDRRNWAHAFERLGEALKGVNGLNLVDG